MLAVNLIIAFVFGLVLWCVGSWALAQLIYRTESRRPEIVEQHYWSVIETFGTILVFLISMAGWLWMTTLLQIWTAD